MKVTFPWYPDAAQPNKRMHWAKKHKAIKKYKQDCLWAMIREGVDKQSDAQPVHVTLTFHEPTEHRRDLDNMQAAAKPLLDAIATGIGIDDFHFTVSSERGKRRAFGCIVADIQIGGDA